jgi:hypothetical protein
MPHNPKNASKASPVPWRELLPVHPAAEIVPMMTDAEIDALADDIKQNKLQQNVVIFVDHDRSESWLDGRNRLEALARLGIHPVRRSLFKGRFPRASARFTRTTLIRTTTLARPMLTGAT